MSDLGKHYARHLSKLFKGRRVLVIGGPVAGLTKLASQLRQLGVERPFLIGSGVGTGALPDENEADWVSLEMHAGSVNDTIRSYERLLTHPPDSVRQRVDAYDPDRTAIAVGGIVLGDVPTVCGRPCYGPRSKDWIALEDKTRIDALWDELGVRRAPMKVVPARADDLLSAARELDSGMGTVWAADARDGAHGGAEKLRVIRDGEESTKRWPFLSAEGDRARVMPFLEGIPCSIHGLVAPDGVAVFRPVELVTLRRRGTNRLLYAGCASYWDPPPADREVMRDVARRVALGLARRFAYRGAFTIDGVMSAEGFLPTELNPRIGAGLEMLGGALPEVPITLLSIAARAGESFEFRPADLERELVAAADRDRRGGAWTVVPHRITETTELGLVVDGHGYRVAHENEDVVAHLSVGLSNAGGFVRYIPLPGHIRAGASVAPHAVRAFALADQELDTRFGTLDCAALVR